MRSYDPHKAPKPADWLELEALERVSLIRAYHRRRRVKLPNPTVHATIHSVVENQLALGEQTPVARTLERLQAEGLDRHEAVHAIGSVLAVRIWDLLRQPAAAHSDLEEEYYAELEKLSADSWRRGGPG
ncbi:MAG TPA: DUF1841 family protein [Acidobacteriota bacterium]